MDMVLEMREAMFPNGDAMTTPSRQTSRSPVEVSPAATNGNLSTEFLATQIVAVQAQLATLTNLLTTQGQGPPSPVPLPNSASAPSPIATSARVLQCDSPYETFTWGDMTEHMVPEEFSLPSVTIKTLWDMWWTGIPSQKIAPLRLLQSSDIKTRNADKVQFSRARTVVLGMIDIAVEQNCVRNEKDLQTMSSQQLDQVFHDMYPTLSSRINGTITPDKKKYKRRIHECMFTTVAAQLSKK